MEECRVQGCKSQIYSLGKCKTHYNLSRSKKFCLECKKQIWGHSKYEYCREHKYLNPVVLKNIGKASSNRGYSEEQKKAIKLKKQASWAKKPKIKKLPTLEEKLRKNLRSRLYRAIKHGYKAGSAVKDLGCSVDEFKVHIESQFKPGMHWENWALNGWHMDHIKPLADFDLSDRKQLLEAVHYTNIRPLWSKHNCSRYSKGKKWKS